MLYEYAELRGSHKSLARYRYAKDAPTVPVISDKALREVKENPDIKQFQSYEVNYDMGVFLCEEESALNKEAVGYYEMLTEMEEKVETKQVGRKG